MRMIGVYDISNERTRRKVAAVLLEYGIRVQLSAFEVELEGNETEEIKARIDALLDPTTDRFALYPVDRRGQRRPLWLGAGPLESMPERKPDFFIA
jgi:CRISPR-associated protein Cas2